MKTIVKKLNVSEERITKMQNKVSAKNKKLMGEFEEIINEQCESLHFYEYWENQENLTKIFERLNPKELDWQDFEDAYIRNLLEKAYALRAAWNAIDYVHFVKQQQEYEKAEPVKGGA